MRWSTSVDLSRADAEEVGWRAMQGRSSGSAERKATECSINTRQVRSMVDGEEGRDVFVSVSVTFLRSAFQVSP